METSDGLKSLYHFITYHFMKTGAKVLQIALFDGVFRMFEKNLKCKNKAGLTASPSNLLKNNTT